MPSGFRFSIGQVMGLIAFSALVMANAVFVAQRDFTFYSVLSAAMQLAGLGVLYYNRRLSRWIWVWIAGESGPLLMIAVQALLTPRFSSDTFLTIYMSLYLGCSLLTLVGFAMTLRELRRRLALYENPPPSESSGSDSPDASI
jgi:hypothetical protein